MNENPEISAESQHNFHFLPLFNSKATGPIFTVFLHDVEQFSGAINVRIRKAMVHFVSERESAEWRQSILTSAKILQN